MEKIFESLIDVVPIIKKLFPEDTAIVIEDINEILYVSDGERIKPPSKIGDKVEQNPVRDRVKREKKTVYTVLTKENHGVDLKLISIPIKDANNNIKGILCVTRNTEKESSVRNISKELMISLVETNNAINEIEDNAEKLSDNVNEILDKVGKTEININESSRVLDLIKSISRQVNMLGLNASIEAAKAGDNGKGFSVVATEMRKLSKLSAESSKQISAYLEEMKNSIESITKSVGNLGDIATSQSDNIEEVSSTIEEITLNSQRLVEGVKID
jgi:predicted transcriptional regulator YheO